MIIRNNRFEGSGQYGIRVWGDFVSVKQIMEEAEPHGPSLFFIKPAYPAI